MNPESAFLLIFIFLHACTSLADVDGCNTLNTKEPCLGHQEGKTGSQFFGNPCNWCCGAICLAVAGTTGGGAKCLPSRLLLYHEDYSGHSINGVGYDTCVSDTPIFPAGSPNYVPPTPSEDAQEDMIQWAGIAFAAICFIFIYTLCAFVITRPKIRDKENLKQSNLPTLNVTSPWLVQSSDELILRSPAVDPHTQSCDDSTEHVPGIPQRPSVEVLSPSVEVLTRPTNNSHYAIQLSAIQSERSTVRDLEFVEKELDVRKFSTNRSGGSLQISERGRPSDQSVIPISLGSVAAGTSTRSQSLVGHMAAIRTPGGSSRGNSKPGSPLPVPPPVP